MKPINIERFAFGSIRIDFEEGEYMVVVVMNRNNIEIVDSTYPAREEENILNKLANEFGIFFSDDFRLIFLPMLYELLYYEDFDEPIQILKAWRKILDNDYPTILNIFDLIDKKGARVIMGDARCDPAYHAQ